MKKIIITIFLCIILNGYSNPIKISEVDVEKILTQKITINELIQQLGKPEKYDPKAKFVELKYKSTNGARIVFGTTGKFVTRAFYLRNRIEGIKPDIIWITTKVTTKDQEETLIFIINKKEYHSLDALKKHFLTLPKDSIIAYANSCVSDGSIEFSSTQQTTLKTFCDKQNITLILYSAE